MGYLSLVLLLSLALPLFIHIFRSKILQKKSLPLPPGPKPFPIIGNILEMGKNPHQSLANLSKIFGPLMTLKLGSITTIVISSPEFAKEALQKHGQALSSRTVPDAARIQDHYKISIGWMPPLDKWRAFRKVIATELFASKKLEASQNIRRQKVQELLGFVRERCENGQAVNIGQAIFSTVLNLLSNTFFSIDLASCNSSVSQEFYGAIVGITEESGKPNVADYFPLLRVLDPQGIRRRADQYFKILYGILDGIITQRLQLKYSSVVVNERRDLLEYLLNVTQEENNSRLSLTDIKHLLGPIIDYEKNNISRIK